MIHESIKVVEGTSVNPEQLPVGRRELQAIYKKNPRIFQEIENLITPLRLPENYPFYLVNLRESFFPNLFGPDASEYIFYVLHYG
ncbi:hypothetical protein PZE06_29115, partial [Robertmurraya sp. DFI.2.37]|uniref:hypothetical protein n=1 Tax=Robertmurraya sp. DFI.2.37 TaxID=3031819 RepID=UPI0023D9FFE2